MPLNQLCLQESLLIFIEASEGALASVNSVHQQELRKRIKALASGAAIIGLPILRLHAPLPPAAAVPLIDAGANVQHATNELNASSLTEEAAHA